MTIFEFISVAVSIVLGLSLSHMLIGISQWADSSGRIKYYLPHTIWLINLTLLHFLWWWSFWDYRDVEWNYGRFITIALEPLSIFLVTSIAVPKLVVKGVTDFGEYFHRVRRWFFIAFLFAESLFILDGPLAFQSEPIWITYRLYQMTVVLAFVLGLAVRREWAQHLSAWAVLANMLWASGLRFTPDAFG